MSESEQSKRIAYSIAQHLQSQIISGVLDEKGIEGVEIAKQCICEAYDIDIENVGDRNKYGVKTTLEELFATIKLEVSEEEKKIAESHKQQGNIHMKFEKFREAIECYSIAVSIDPNNATYYCNRAAAHIKLDNLDSAVTDCKKALSLNPNYARAYGRLGYIYSSQNKFELSKECFEKALLLDPENESYRTNLQTVEEQLRAVPPSAASGGGTEGVPGDGADPGAGLGGLLNIVQNPDFMNMAASLMQTPAFQNMASQMISRGVIPTDLSDVPSDMLSGMSQAARDIQQNNPEVFQNLLHHQAGGGLSQQSPDTGAGQQEGQGQPGNSSGGGDTGRGKEK